ncbi:MAG: tetratricopeptide repeat protein [Pseudomonadota bacterium]
MIDRRINFILRYLLPTLFTATLSGCVDMGAPYGGRQAPVYGGYPRTYPPDVSRRPPEDYQLPQRNQPYVPPPSTRPVPRKPYQAPEAPAVVALLEEAEHSRRSGNLDAAVATTERALRIEPRNPRLMHQLARLRLQQNNPRLAEALAKKSNVLAGGDPELTRKNWLIIAAARRQQGNEQGAQEAERRARRY